MSPQPAPARHRKVRALVAAASAVMLLGGAAACSSSSDATRAGGNSATSSSRSDSGATSKSSADEGLPDGFPDVPMPVAEKVSVVKSATDATPGIWVVVATIDPTLTKSGESLLAAYGAQLEAAGFTVDDGDGSNLQAENDDWTINAHSSMDGTLTIGTVPQ